MAAVHTPVDGFNGTVVGVDFVDGVGETENEAAIAYFVRHGYDIVETAAGGLGAPAGDGDQGDGAPAGDGLADLTVAELRDLAKDADIDLGGATLKADIITIIEQAEADAAGGLGAPADGDQGD